METRCLIRILKFSRKKIRTANPYICLAIDDYTNERAKTAKGRVKAHHHELALKRWISNQLNGGTFKAYAIGRISLYNDFLLQDWVDFRKTWIDIMIAALEKDGLDALSSIQPIKTIMREIKEKSGD